jgi:hypothetical protein
VDDDGSAVQGAGLERRTPAPCSCSPEADPILLLDTKGKDSNGLLDKVNRWDPPVVDTLDTSPPTPAGR